MKRGLLLSLVLVVGACTGEGDVDDLEDEEVVEQTPQPPDDMAGQTPAPPDPTWQPKAFGKSRFVVFYQLSGDLIDLYANSTTGLPHVADHGYVFTQSHASVGASREMADRIHAARDDFYYAPAFDVWERDGWLTASDAQLRAWAHEFRDEAIGRHADMFTFNEAPSTTAENVNVRVRIIKILRALNEPDAQGRRLRGVFYFTERSITASNWDEPATEFWRTLDETCDIVIAEHYHSQGFVCTLSEAALAEHLFAMRRWLDESGDPAKIRIANQKYTVLHSTRLAPGTSGWAGADSNRTSLAAFQRALSKLTKVTRNTPGGLNRIAYAPVTTAITSAGVEPRLMLLARWHYGAATTDSRETACVAGAQVNCTCSAP
jgi:hypothetical protein